MKEVRYNIERAERIMELSKRTIDRECENKERPKKKKLIATRECGNCKYFDEYDEKVKEFIAYDGRCRRYPETVEKDNCDWCGEFAMVSEPKIFEEREEVTL